MLSPDQLDYMRDPRFTLLSTLLDLHTSAVNAYLQEHDLNPDLDASYEDAEQKGRSLHVIEYEENLNDVPLLLSPSWGVREFSPRGKIHYDKTKSIHRQCVDLPARDIQITLFGPNMKPQGTGTIFIRPDLPPTAAHDADIKYVTTRDKTLDTDDIRVLDAVEQAFGPAAVEQLSFEQAAILLATLQSVPYHFGPREIDE